METTEIYLFCFNALKLFNEHPQILKNNQSSERILMH